MNPWDVVGWEVAFILAVSILGGIVVAFSMRGDK